MDLMCEPWCWPPGVVGRLTDDEIEAIRAAQSERVERARREADPGGTPAPPPPPAGRPPPRAALVNDLMELGYTREQAERAYDAQLAAWKAKRGSP